MLSAGSRVDECAEGPGLKGHFLLCGCLTTTPFPFPGFYLAPVRKVVFWTGEEAGGRVAGLG